MPRPLPDSLIEAPSTLPTPALSDSSLNYTYAISRGETGVLTFEPYKSILLPYWRFRTVPIARSSASALESIFNSYGEAGDFVGMDMTRKFIQMGMTRPRRYANHRGGRKYGKGGKEGGKVLEKWTGKEGEEQRRQKEEASEVFKEVLHRCRSDKTYSRLKSEWQAGKKEWERGKS